LFDKEKLLGIRLIKLNIKIKLKIEIKNNLRDLFIKLLLFNSFKINFNLIEKKLNLFIFFFFLNKKNKFIIKIQLIGKLKIIKSILLNKLKYIFKFI